MFGCPATTRPRPCGAGAGSSALPDASGGLARRCPTASRAERQAVRRWPAIRRQTRTTRCWRPKRRRRRRHPTRRSSRQQRWQPRRPRLQRSSPSERCASCGDAQPRRSGSPTLHAACRSPRAIRWSRDRSPRGRCSCPARRSCPPCRTWTDRTRRCSPRWPASATARCDDARGRCR